MASKEPTFRSAEEEDEAFDQVTTKGLNGGLFRACMQAIRSAHFQSNRFRAVLVVAGLFSDKAIYREVLSIFYTVTRELETALEKEKGDEICQKLLSLGYHFTPQYENDLACLYGSLNWKEQVDAVVSRNQAAVEYRDKIKNMKTGAELAGAAFVLWGALIIGGGAAVAPKVKKYGAVNLFQDVTGPGREDRKRNFIQTWDSLADKSSENFNEIVKSSKACMQCNNNVLSSLARNPWWFPYAVSVVVGIASVAVVMIHRKWTKQ